MFRVHKRQEKMSKKKVGHRENTGLNEQVVREISAQKQEPEWMLAFRLRALAIFEKKAMPTWGADLSELSCDDICFYVKPMKARQQDWQMVP